MKEAFEAFVKAKSVTHNFASKTLYDVWIENEHPNNPNRVTYKYVVKSGDVNLMGTLHGGATATIIDVLTSVSIAKVINNATVSASLTTEYYSPAQIGDEIRI